MKYHVRNLTGMILNYAVAKAMYDDLVFVANHMFEKYHRLYTCKADKGWAMWPDVLEEPFDSEHDSKPAHQVWAPVTTIQGDEIIDWEKISTVIDHSGIWIAYKGYNLNDEKQHMVAGATRREAAMRCFVMSRFGQDIEIPDEVCTNTTIRKR